MNDGRAMVRGLVPVVAALGAAMGDEAFGQTFRLVADINQRTDARIDRFIDAGERACFRYETEKGELSLWSSDGTAGGTHRVDAEVATDAAFGFSYMWSFDGRVYLNASSAAVASHLVELDPVTGHTWSLLSEQSVPYLNSGRILALLWPFGDRRGVGLVRPGTGFQVVPVQGIPDDMYLAQARFADVDARWLFMQNMTPPYGGTSHLWRIDEDTGESVDVPGVPLRLEELSSMGGALVGRHATYVGYPRYYEEKFVWIDPESLEVGQLDVPTTLDLGYEALATMRCGDRVYFNARVYAQAGAPPRLYWFDAETHSLDFIETSVRPDKYNPGVAVIGDDLYYPALTPDVGNELRRYRRGAAAPELIADINPGGDSLQRQRDGDGGPWAMALGHRLLMRADDGSSGLEPWVFDADTGVTWRLMDVMPGSGGSGPVFQGVSGDLLYFLANDGVHGRELWVTDGTPEGTHLVRDIQTGTNSSSPGGFVRLGDQLLFDARESPGQDGIYAVPLGETPASPARQPFGGASVGQAVRAGALTFLQAYDGEAHQWYFVVGDGSQPWRNVPYGLFPASSCGDGGPWTYSPMIPCPSGGLFVSSGSELWITDGSLTRTYPLVAGVSMCEWVMAGSRLIFVGQSPPSGKELWTSDGNYAGTHIVADLVPGAVGSNPRGLVLAGEDVYFEAEDTEGATRVWVLNSRTNEVRVTSCPIATLGLDNPRSFGFVQGRLLIGELTPFWGGHPIYNWSPTTGEVGQVPPLPIQIQSYATGSPPFVPWNDRYVVFGATPQFGTAPYSYDPITGAYLPLLDTTAGVGGGAGGYLTIARGVMFYSAFDPEFRNMLWRTDATPGGTIPIGTPSAPANVSGYKALMIGQHLYLGAADAEHGHEVWVIDFCGADYNYDRAVTIDDLLTFLKDFEGQSVEADLSGAGVAGDFPDGATTIDDLLYFLVHFEVGC